MTTRVLLFAAVFAFALARVAAGQPSSVSTQPVATHPSSSVAAAIESKSDLFVGQRVTLVVTLRTPGIFASAASWGLPTVPGLLLMPPADRPVVGSETVGDVSFTTQRYELNVLPRAGGEQTIPPFTVRFGMKRSPLDHDVIEQSVTTPAVKLTVKTPPGAEKLRAVLSATDLSLTETWNRDPATAKPGDAFVRTVRLRATGLPAMALPPIQLPAIPGVAIYASPADVKDSTNRGDLVGERTQTFTYVCQQPGSAVVPAIRLQWFDLSNKTFKSTELPKRTLAVVGPSVPATQPATTRRPDQMVVIVAFVMTTIVAVSMRWTGAWRVVPRMTACFRPRRLVRLNP